MLQKDGGGKGAAAGAQNGSAGDGNSPGSSPRHRTKPVLHFLVDFVKTVIKGLGDTVKFFKICKT